MDLEADSQCCSGCDERKPSQDFHQGSRRRRGLYSARRASARDMSDADDGCVTPPRADTGSQDALYIMRYDRIPRELMIGRAVCVETRARQLEAGMNFHMVILATFPGLGHLEPRVHAMLSESRSHEGPGHQWFNVPLDAALHAIALAARGQ